MKQPATTMRSLLLAFAAAPAAFADTISNCGADTDHLKITSITTDADATGGPKKGEPFTITVEGELDEDHQHGTVTGDLQLKALGIVNEKVTFNQTYDEYPGQPKGPFKLTIGPFTFPRAIPGEVDVTGPIKIVNGNMEPLMCINLNLKIPMIISSWSETLYDTFSAAAGLFRENCGDPTQDHIQNVVSNVDANNVITTTMDLDEDLDYINLSCDLAVKAPVVPAVNLKLPSVPISISPAMPKGQLKFVGYPNASRADGLKDVITVTGDLKLSDKNAEEVACIDFGGDSSVVV